MCRLWPWPLQKAQASEEQSHVACSLVKEGRTLVSVSNSQRGFQVVCGGLTCAGRSGWCLQQVPSACSCRQRRVGFRILCHHRGGPLCQTGCGRRRRLEGRGCLWSTWLGLGGSGGSCRGTAALLQGGQTGPTGGTVHRHLHSQQTPSGELTRFRSSSLCEVMHVATQMMCCQLTGLA